ncbi:MAG TPA: hypothetical protein EYN67_12710 [Flavobacteriales bacterium]|nr:hypothetical protein [Methylococcaceae bacterium]HHZ96383.1 hypothetical protein [Flavobacteriales bacterium]
MGDELSNEELLTLLGGQKVLESALGFSRSQAWRIVNGKSKLTPQARELIILKLGIHPTLQLTDKA